MPFEKVGVNATIWDEKMFITCNKKICCVLCLKTIFCSKFIYDQSRNRTFKICISLFMILKWVLSLQFAKNLDFDPKPETNHWITTQAQKFKYLGTKIQNWLFFGFFVNLNFWTKSHYSTHCDMLLHICTKDTGDDSCFATPFMVWL